MRGNMEYFGEEDFNKNMEIYVNPFLRLNLREDFFDGHDNSVITYSYLKNPQEKGVVVISHGFCEFVCKYHEMMYYMYNQGYSVFYIDHRGHGYSQRALEDSEKVYVGDFDEYVEDLKKFIDEIVVLNSSTQNRYLFAHSMGGAIAALFMEKYPDYFTKAILSSPMIEMTYGKMSRWQVKTVLFLADILKWGERYISGQHGFDNVYVYETSSAQSEARYKYCFNARLSDAHYRTYGGTYAWLKAAVRAYYDIMKNAGQIKTPVLLFQAGRDTLVSAKAQNEFAEKVTNISIEVFENSKHEIFNAYDEDRYKYYERVFEFLNS